MGTLKNIDIIIKKSSPIRVLQYRSVYMLWTDRGYPINHSSFFFLYLWEATFKMLRRAWPRFSSCNSPNKKGLSHPKYDMNEKGKNSSISNEQDILLRSLRPLQEIGSANIVYIAGCITPWIYPRRTHKRRVWCDFPTFAVTLSSAPKRTTD